MRDFGRAHGLLRQFKGDTYLYGVNVLGQVGRVVASQGKRAILVRDAFPMSDEFAESIRESVAAAGVELIAEITGAGSPAI